MNAPVKYPENPQVQVLPPAPIVQMFINKADFIS